MVKFHAVFFFFKIVLCGLTVLSILLVTAEVLNIQLTLQLLQPPAVILLGPVEFIALRQH